ncbi:hypothetical protein [Actinomadura sp. 7K507]|uniref:hypothetical protein n=1 Tax=Actinomadura sp. 7K507 TaxID=2530365 RepID=UPI0010511841|nr:hypothetical protein [Actinomadura sp. 7K507]TDC80856.1 hypothetical protein E1285_34025 [Actinomadura sp. 7K507]
MAGLIGIIVGVATLLLQFSVIRACGLDESSAAVAVVRACAASAVLASWVAIDRADRRAGSPSSRTLVAVPVAAALVALFSVKAMPVILAGTEPAMYAGAVAAVVLGSAAGALAAFGRDYLAAGLTVLITAVGEQAVSLAVPRMVWLVLPVVLLFVLLGTRPAGRAGPLPVAVAAGAPVAVAAVVVAVGVQVAGDLDPAPVRLWWLTAGCALGGLVAVSVPVARRFAPGRVRAPGGLRRPAG